MAGSDSEADGCPDWVRIPAPRELKQQSTELVKGLIPSRLVAAIFLDKIAVKTDSG